MNRQITKPASVRGMMVRHYLILAVALSLAGSTIVFYLFYGLEKNYDNSLTSLVLARDVVTAEDPGPMIKQISEYGGWVEILNDQREVVQTIGHSKESTVGYTEDELQQFLENDPNADYYYSIAPPLSGDYSGYYLLKLPMELVDGNHIVNPTRLNRGIMLYLATSVGAFAAVTALFIWGYSQITSMRINMPLEQLHASMQEVMGGHYGARLQFDAAYEFQSIRDTFNYMVDKLQLAEQEKKAYENARHQLLSGLAHDLKTPLSTIGAFAAALRDGMVPQQEKQLSYLTAIAQKSERMNELIDSLFEYTILNQTSFNLDRVQTDLCEVVREVTAEHYAELEEKNFTVICSIPEEPLIHMLDLKHFNRALANLIVNAIKYNPVGTTFSIRLAGSSEDGSLLEIADNGIGIEPYLWPVVFDAFVRGDHARRSSGTGLGLAICRRIVELHEGTISLAANESERTVFRIWLPSTA